MGKTHRSKPDTTKPAPSPNPRDKQRSRTDHTMPIADEIEPELAPKTLDKDFSAMHVDDARPPAAPNLLPVVFAGLVIPNASAFYLMHKDSNIQALTTAEIFGEAPDTFHQLNRFSKASAGSEGIPKTTLTVQDYTKLFRQSFPDKKDPNPSPSTTALRHLALRLALTDPVELFTPFALYWSADHRLVSSDMTCAWLASYQLFGAPWKRDRVHFFPASAAAAAPAKKRSARFSSTVETVPTGKPANGANRPAAPPIPLNPYRITTPTVRAMVNPARAAMDRLHVTHITFVRLLLPRTQAHQGFEQMNEIASSLRFFLLHLTRLDTAAKWLPWHEDDFLNPPYGRDRMSPPSHKAVLQDYSENGAFTAKGSAPILRIRLGHSIAPSAFTGAQFQSRLRANGITLTVCRIQSAEEQLLGHMLGSHPDIFKPDNWHAAHSLVPAIAAAGDFEFRSGYFDVDPDPEENRWDNRSSNKSPKVIQVWCSLSGARPLRNALSTLYSSKNTGPLPMGWRMRFIPNVANPRLIVTSDDRIMAKKGRSKQRKFLEKMLVTHNYTIIGLRYPLAEYGDLTLHDAVSSLCSRDDPNSPLFSAVEDMGSKVAFLYRRDRSEEALTVIPALPLVLAHLIGANIWPWFDDQARSDCVGFRYDPIAGVQEIGQEMSDQPDATRDDLSEFSGGDDDDDFLSYAMQDIVSGVDEVAAAAYSLKLSVTRPAMYDEGSIKTVMQTPLPTTTSALPPEVSTYTAPTQSSTLTSTQTPEAILATLLPLNLRDAPPLRSRPKISSTRAAVDPWGRLRAIGTRPSGNTANTSQNLPDHRKRKKVKKPPKYRRTSTTVPSVTTTNPLHVIDPPSTSDSVNPHTTPFHNPTQFHQLDLHRRDQTATDVEEFGDPFRPPGPQFTRLCFQNVNNLPASGLTAKSRNCVSFMVESLAGVFGFVETGLFWPKLPDEDYWDERIFSCKDQLRLRSSRSQLAYNTTEPQRTNCHQHGGCGLLTTNATNDRMSTRGSDPSGLGRWSWMLFEGKPDHRTRVICGYRPCHSLDIGSTYQQHRRYLGRCGRESECPRAAFLLDLLAACNFWLQQGDGLIVMMDANSDVRDAPIRTSLASLSMREVILERHSGLSPPSTHGRNHTRTPIDGIWASAGIRISAGGYLAFGRGCPSDHRTLWIDVPNCDFLGFDSAKYCPPTPRRLNSRDPRTAITYKRLVHAQFESNKLVSRLASVSIEAQTDGWSHDLEARYNEIHSEQQQIRLDAERKCRKLHMGAVPWSPKLQQFRSTIDFWSCMLRKRRRVQVSLCHIRRLLASISIEDEDPFLLSTETIVSRLDNAHKSYKLAKSDASNWRNDFLHSLASSRAEQNGTTTDRELQQLRAVSSQRRTSQRIKRMQNRLNQPATNQVFVTTDGIRRVVTDPEEIFEVCMQENEARFSQTEHTPPMLPPLLPLLGYLGDGPAASSILDGSFEAPPSLDQYTVKFLEMLRRPASIAAMGPISPVISWSDHQTGWKRIKERTSASADSPSFSHYKVSAPDPVLGKFDSVLRSLPPTYGFSPVNWEQITDVAILKKAGVYDVEKMRTITLMHATMNMNNKTFARRMMAQAEAAGTLAKEQNGSRKHHRAILAALNKRLTCDLLRLQRRSAALASTDLKSNYDRIVHSVAALCMQRQGLTPPITKSMLLPLQRSWHRVRTAFGTSSTKYGGDREIPLQGVGQGNGAGPAIWAVVSSPLIAMMGVAGFGLSIVTALSFTLLFFVCYAFVDDTDLINSGDTVDTTGESVLLDMQRFVDHWEGGARATGAAMQVRNKSWWYLIDFRWDGSKWGYRSIAQLPGNITMRETDGNRYVLPRVEPGEARETLGVFLSMDGNFRDQVDALRLKTAAFGLCLRQSRLTRSEAWLALRTTLWKRIEYPMEAVTLTAKEWKKVLQPIMTPMLHSCGFVQSFKHDVLFGPPDALGLQLKHPFANQFVKQLQVVLDCTSAPSVTQQLLVGTAEQLRLEIGYPGSFAEAPFCGGASAYFTPCWWVSLLTELARREVLIHDSLPQLLPNRVEDRFLMKAFVDGGFRGEDLRRLSSVRQFLQVTTLSDICDVSGRYIALWAWDAGRANPSPIHRYQWPRRAPNLSCNHLAVWRRALLQVFCDDRRRVRSVLGDWLPDRLQSWPWRLHPNSLYLYVREGALWWIYSMVPGYHLRLISRQFERSLEHGTPVIGSRPCSVEFLGGGFARVLCQVDMSPPVPMAAPSRASFEDLVALLPESERWALHRNIVSDNGADLAAAIVRGDASAVSDGSFKGCVGTSSSVLRSPGDRRGAIVSVCRVPGDPSDQSAYRSELAGILCSLLVIEIVCTLHRVSTGGITVALDGQQALLNASSDWPLRCTQPCFDLLKAIRVVRDRLPVSLQWKWIRGHQDDSTLFRDLSPLAQDNVIADHYARSFLHEQLASGWLPVAVPLNEGWYVTVSGRKLSSLHADRMYHQLWPADLRSYWSQKFHWPDPVSHTVDWTALGACFRPLPFSRQRLTVKLANGQLGVGRQMFRYGFQSHDHCPRCDAPDEDTSHVLLCQSTAARSTVQSSLRRLQSWMETNSTDPAITSAIMSGLTGFFRGTQANHCPRSAREAFRDQSLIGWRPLLYGFASTRWQVLQHRHLASIKSRRSCLRWTIAWLRQLMEVSWDMWDNRNFVLHHTLHPAAVRERDALDVLIRAQFSLGVSTLLRDDHFLLVRNPVDHVLSSYSVPSKLQWLELLDLARLRYSASLLPPPATLQQQRLRAWLLPA